jgi:hypothetical protein
VLLIACKGNPILTAGFLPTRDHTASRSDYAFVPPGR